MGLTVTTLVATTLLTASSIISTTSPYSQNWAVQFGTPGHEGIRSLAVDSKGRYYVGGYRDSDDEVPNSGYSTYLQQVEPSGDLGWLRQPSGPLSDSDVSQAMTILDDRVSFITRFNTDVVPELYSFDAAGDLYTTAIEDFPDATSAFAPFSLTADADGSFVVGGIKAVKLNETNSFDVFVSKISNAGQTEWVRTNVFSSFLNGAGYVAVDAQGSIYVAGESSANDVQVEKFDADGVHLWSRTFGTPEQEVVYDITLDAKGHAMVIGTTYGDFGGPSAGREDGFALNVKPNGELDWVTQFGGPGYERAYGVDVAPNGHIFVAGQRVLVLDDVFSLRNADAYWTELDSNGTQLWSEEFGTVGQYDGVFEVLVDDAGDVLLGGQTGGSLFGTHIETSDHDAFVVKFNVNAVPEPAAVVLYVVAALALCTSVRTRMESNRSDSN